MKHFVGIDPGKSGAIAIIDSQMISHDIISCPSEASELSEVLREIWADYHPVCVAMERVWSPPGYQGAFEFGRNFGRYEGVLATIGLPLILVVAKTWQKQFLEGIPGDTKERSLSVAKGLFPNARIGKNHNKSDALLLALYAKKHAA